VNLVYTTLMSFFTSSYARAALAIGGLFIAFGGGYYSGFSQSLAPFSALAQVANAQMGYPQPRTDLEPLWKVWALLDEKFVPAAVGSSTPATSTDEERIWAMAAGLAASMNDPYTAFFPPVESKQFAESIQGSFEGVGMEIAVKDGILTVVTPAQRNSSLQGRYATQRSHS
jgi:C-terminal processing protease CtpA/Prc